MKLQITNTTAGPISIAYTGLNGIIKFIDIHPYALMQEVIIHEDEKDAFNKAFENYIGKLHIGKMKAEKAATINEDIESERLKDAEDTFDKEVSDIENTFNTTQEDSKLDVSMKPKSTKKK